MPNRPTIRPLIEGRRETNNGICAESAVPSVHFGDFVRPTSEKEWHQLTHFLVPHFDGWLCLTGKQEAQKLGFVVLPSRETIIW